MALICREIVEQIEETVWEPVEEWVEKREKKCKKKKCKKLCLCCNKWFCWIETFPLSFRAIQNSHVGGHQITNRVEKTTVDPNPFRQFEIWSQAARAAGVSEQDTISMTLATATRFGSPSARIVLLKSFDERGFIFYTNYNSRKGIELEENARACLLFYWPALWRQVRIEGTVERVSEEESDQYFHSRPLGSRIGAWAHPNAESAARARSDGVMLARLCSARRSCSRPK